MQKLGAITFLIVFLTFSAAAQVPGEKCRGPIYKGNQVSKPAKMIDQPNFSVLYRAFGNDVSGRVTLEAVLCRSGRITDIRLIDSQPPKIGEFVAAALTLVRFKPAELNWHTVSQRRQFEFNFNQSEPSPIDAAAAAGRLVEELDIMGNRRLTHEQILQLIKTRAGDIYNADQVQKDLMALLATGQFNATGTRVSLDDAMMGGVRITFEVFELPLISEIRIEGLKAGDESAVFKELVRQRVDVTIGRPLNSAGLKKATRVIEQLFQSQGWINIKAEALVESTSTTQVKVVLKIHGRDF